MADESENNTGNTENGSNGNSNGNQNMDLLLGDNSNDGIIDIGPQKGPLASFFSNVDVLRQISMIIGLLIVLAIVVIIWSWGKEADYRPLGTYQTEELITTLDFLDQQKIEYRLEGNNVLVMSDEYQKIKLQMTRAGLAIEEAENGDDILFRIWALV